MCVTGRQFKEAGNPSKQSNITNQQNLLKSSGYMVDVKLQKIFRTLLP